jgi:hypothetical protein
MIRDNSTSRGCNSAQASHPSQMPDPLSATRFPRPPTTLSSPCRLPGPQSTQPHHQCRT